jgi:hypothetical protein
MFLFVSRWLSENMRVTGSAILILSDRLDMNVDEVIGVVKRSIGHSWLVE